MIRHNVVIESYEKHAKMVSYLHERKEKATNNKGQDRG